MYSVDYILILIFIVIGAGMALAMYLLSKVLSPSSPDSEKLSAYECGFEAFDDARSKFDVYPSAYANAWAAKQYKKAGGGWKKG